MKLVNVLFISWTIISGVSNDELTSIKYQCNFPLNPIIINSLNKDDKDYIVIYNIYSKVPYALIYDNKTFIDNSPIDSNPDLIFDRVLSIDELCMYNPNNSDV